MCSGCKAVTSYAVMTARKNQIFDSYVKFGNSTKADMLPTPKAVLEELVEGYSEDQLMAIIERTHKKVAVDNAFQLRGRHDFEASIDILGYLLKASGIPHKHITDEDNKNRHSFIIRYGMGRKFSFFAVGFLKAGFELISTKKVEYTITHNMVAVTIEGQG